METVINNTLPPQDGRRYVHNGTEWVLAESEQDQAKKKWYNLKQAMAYTNCKEHTLRNAIRCGYLIATKVPSGSRNGYAMYICEDDLDAWVKEPKVIRDQKAHDEYNAYMRKFSHKSTAQKEEKPSIDILHVDGKNLYTISAAAKTWGINAHDIQRGIRSGFLKKTVVNNESNKKICVYIDEDDLLDWLDDRTKVRDPEVHEQYKAYKRDNYAKNHPKKADNDIPDTKPVKEVSVEDLYGSDINRIAEFIAQMIEEKTKASYKLGFEDGKLSVQHDKDDTYQKGFREGIKEGRNQAYDELQVYLRESKK